jgi:hypothetical protein
VTGGTKQRKNYQKLQKHIQAAGQKLAIKINKRPAQAAYNRRCNWNKPAAKDDSRNKVNQHAAYRPQHRLKHFHDCSILSDGFVKQAEEQRIKRRPGKYFPIWPRPIQETDSHLMKLLRIDTAVIKKYNIAIFR